MSKGFTLDSINGVKVVAPQCVFCGSEMKQGGSTLGCGTNFINYSCSNDKCNTRCSFMKPDSNREIKTCSMQVEYEE